jgi:multiple sugar transport system permease protein
VKAFRRFLRRFGTYASVLAVILIFVGPMVWITLNSFKTEPELLSVPPTFLPKKFTLQHYANLFKQSNFEVWYRNSSIVAAATAVISSFAATLGAYSLYRCRYRGRRAFNYIFLSSYMFPRVLMLIPLYMFFARVGLLDTPLALVVVFVGTTMPFGVTILRSFFQSIPESIEEAALVDGANRLQIIFKLFVPLAAPGVAAVALNAFLMSWSEYLFARGLIYSDQMKVLPHGMELFLTAYKIDWGIMLAGSVLIAAPPILGFMAAGKFFIKGLTAGGEKG